MIDIKYINSVLYLRKKYILSKGISINTIESWSRDGKRIGKINIENQLYIAFKDIPNPSLIKLPSEAELRELLKEQNQAETRDNFFKMLQYAQQTEFLKFQKVYRDKYDLPTDKALEKAMKAAVWEKIMSVKEENGGSNATELFNAFTRLYPGSYSSLSSFSKTCGLMRNVGALEYCIDRRSINNKENTPNKKYDARQFEMVIRILSVGKGFKAPQIRKRMQKACVELGIECPSISWIKGVRKNFMNNKEAYKKRFGQSEVEKTLPFASMLPAEFAGDQWQIDGFTMPFAFQHKDANGKISFKRPTLNAIMDDYSKKIVGYSVTLTENRESLFEALQIALKTTGHLPYEIISDNHSYNQTKEVEFFKKEIKNLGVTWTVSSNPRRKITLENSFLHISELHCKGYKCYLGLSIKAKGKDARPKQEYIDKSFSASDRLAFDEIKAIAITIVKEWNEQIAPGRSASPNTLYEQSQKPHIRPIDIMDRLRLFNKRTEFKISRYQINIKVAGFDKALEYQLPAENFDLDGKRVVVIYESFDEIFLFEPGTERFLCSLKQKEKAHRALANQTENDTKILHTQAARRKSAITQGRKELQELTDEAAALDPRLHGVLSGLTQPKDILQEIQESADLATAMRVNGIDPNRLEIAPVKSEMDMTDYSKTSKRKKSPYEPVNHKIEEIKLDEY